MKKGIAERSFFSLIFSEYWKSTFQLTYLPIAFLFLCFLYFLYQNVFSLSIIFLVLGIIIFITATSFVCHLRFKHINVLKTNMPSISACKDCVLLKANDESFLMKYNLITAASLDRIERTLCEGDQVLIYTSHLNTEPEDTVKFNNQRGIIYDILYYDGSFENIPSLDIELYKTQTKLKIQQNGFDSQLAIKKTGFDFFSYKKHDTGEITAYYAVNYSVGSKKCIDQVQGRCQNPCDKENKTLLYKKLSQDLAEAIFYDLLGKRELNHERAKRE